MCINVASQVGSRSYNQLPKIADMRKQQCMNFSLKRKTELLEKLATGGKKKQENLV